MIIILVIIIRVLAVEISCPHSLDNRAKKDFEKTEKYQPLHRLSKLFLNTAIDPDFKCCNIDRGQDKP